jgi:hypothetical protein
MSKTRVSTQASASLFGALKEEFLLNRYVSGSQAANIKNRGLQILFNRMERMSDNMLLKTIKELSEIGALDMAAITGIPMPGENRISTSSIQQAFELPGERLRSLLGPHATSNPVKQTGEVLEALEHIERHFKERAPPQIKPSTEGG